MKAHALVPLVLALLSTAIFADSLDEGFSNPPEATKPWCYWYWLSDNISREGITKDLEAMKRVGIGEAFIGNIYLDDIKVGNVKALTEEWWQMVEHAVREGDRIGVNIGLFNCPGWSQSGGPWIKPSQAMRYIAFSEQRVKGPAHFEQKLIAPKPDFQQLSVLAFPAPLEDASALANLSPRISCTPELSHAGRLIDGDRSTSAMFPAGAGQGTQALGITLELSQPLTARSLMVVPAQTDFAAQCELQAASDGGQFETIRSFPVDRSNNGVNVGFIPYAPVSIAFPATTARKFRLLFSSVRGKAGLSEIELSGAARVERFVEKQLGKMHPTPLPMWNAYLWPASAKPESNAFAIDPAKVIDLKSTLSPDGTLRWDVPEGEWIILNAGLVPTGTKNSPASPQGQGLEVDKMNGAAANYHFDAYVGELLRRMPKADRKALRHVVADSYEMGSQDWTDGMREIFKTRCGYDPQSWLPVLTGRLVGGSEQSDRFLWDLRRLVADRIATEYVGGLREDCRKNGLQLWLENYGHWGFPAEFLQYGGQSDEVSGEFWATGDLGSIELRCASSAAHIYGKRIVHAEAFTSGLHFESTPWSLKKRGDWALTEGINHWVLHVYIHQPWDDRVPGVNAWFSTEFNRHNTWFFEGREWIDYYRRCDFLLQQGRHVADVAYFIGEDTPKMTGVRKPELPPGYDYDYINAEVIEQKLKVKNGRFALPDGTSYGVLVLPELETMRPELLQKIRDLVKAGGTILGEPPLRSPSMKNFPFCDERVRQLATELWAGCDGTQSRQARFGKGRVFRNVDLAAVFNALSLKPDVDDIRSPQILWTHRSSERAEIFFISNQGEASVRINPVFRVSGKAPELWNAVDAKQSLPAAYRVEDGAIRVPIELEPRGSAFVVFRHPLPNGPGIQEVRRGHELLLSTSRGPQKIASKEKPNTFTMAGWVRPEIEVALPRETNAGVFINLSRNDAVSPVHGNSINSAPGHAGAGISAGRNGVCVYEHSADYFAPVLVAPATLTNWAHLAVVYSGGQPALFLNGQQIRQGLPSRFTVHSSVNYDQGGAQFKGQKSGFASFDRALDGSEIAALAAKGPPPTEGPLPLIQITRGRLGQLHAAVSSPGSYQLQLSDGSRRALEVPDFPAPFEFTGSWRVSFSSRLGDNPPLLLDRLASLTSQQSPGVKYFSGTAIYEKSLELPANLFGPDKRILLDMGTVESVAEVAFNGIDLGVFWKPPYLVDVTASAKPGSNSLKVRVTGTWHNRLVGAARYPDGLPGVGSSRAMLYLTANTKPAADAPLSPFGLLGPVRAIVTRLVEIPR